MNRETFESGVLVERITDHGDSTGTLERFDEHGNVTHVEQVTGLPTIDPDPASEAEAVAKATALAMALLEDPERFETLVAAVANTAKGALVYVSDAIQTAAEVTP